jgi:hypothetical protein
MFVSEYIIYILVSEYIIYILVTHLSEIQTNPELREIF